MRMRAFRLSVFAFTLLLGSAVPALAGIRVVSDIDDTLKITNVGDPLAMVVNGLFSSRAFAGMRELYVAFGAQRSYAFDYVTGAPEILGFRVRKFLYAGGFPPGGIHLKPSGRESTRAYKVRVIRALFDANPSDRFILIGDDTQADFDAYDDLFRAAPDRILAIYIRQVTHRRLPPSASGFLTAFDIARTEYLMDRFTVDQTAPVAFRILNEPRVKRIIPAFGYCPVRSFVSMDSLVGDWDRAIDARVLEICLARERSAE